MFMESYRTAFPQATVLPKMHILEEHVVPWLKEWRVGFGLMGEQGVESIHVYFNSLTRTYHSIPDRVDCFRAMMREHSLHSIPTLVTERRPVKRRKANSKKSERIQEQLCITTLKHTYVGAVLRLHRKMIALHFRYRGNLISFA